MLLLLLAGPALAGAQTVQLQARVDSVRHEMLLELGPFDLPAHTGHMSNTSPPPRATVFPFDAWLHGYAIDVRQRPGTLEYRFKVQNKGRVVNASYTGIVPDTFKDDAEVVLKGRLAPDGFHVEPNGVMAKCPSKYEAQKKVG